jgi:predicted O-methyltransferase YrrM
MDDGLFTLLAELEHIGADNDDRAAARADKLLNITHDTGVFLNLLVGAVRAHRIVEVGTGNGYSTLWLAEAARATGGRVDTVEGSPAKASLATANFTRAGLSEWIGLHQGEAGAFLAGFPAASVDFLFLDAERYEYPDYWPDLQRVLVPNGLIVVDNAVSHAEELAPFAAAVTATPGYQTALVPVGKGEWLILKPSGR